MLKYSWLKVRCVRHFALVNQGKSRHIYMGKSLQTICCGGLNDVVAITQHTRLFQYVHFTRHNTTRRNFQHLLVARESQIIFTYCDFEPAVRALSFLSNISHPIYGDHSIQIRVSTIGFCGASRSTKVSFIVVSPMLHKI